MEVNPPIPDKLYFTISEVAVLCDVKPHVLRYWEQEFRQLNPTKRRGNRRYYQHKDVLIVREIKNLLYQQGYTIAGARQCLSLRLRTLNQVGSVITSEKISLQTDSQVQSNPAINQLILDLEALLKELQ
jgi:DNA-binding transcriptional MerR regulator